MLYRYTWSLYEVNSLHACNVLQKKNKKNPKKQNKNKQKTIEKKLINNDDLKQST